LRQPIMCYKERRAARG